MPVIYLFRCPKCKSVREVDKPYGVSDVPAPLCENGHGPMNRAFTAPAAIKVKNGTPNFYGPSGVNKRQPYDKGRHAEDFQESEIQAGNLERECADMREESKKDYYANGLHHAHGFGSPEDDMAASREIRAKEEKIKAG